MNVPIPTIEMPAPLAAAAQALNEREQELRGAEAAVVAASEAVLAGHRRDVEALAAAREAGEKDPPAHHEDKARRELETAERDLEIMRARVAKLRAEHERMAEQQRPLWRERVGREWRKLDKAQRRRVAELAAAAERVQELQVAWRYLDALDHDPGAAERTLRKAMAPVAAVQVDLTDVLAAVEASSADAVIDRLVGARREQREREESQRLADEAVQEQIRRDREAETERIRVRREALS